MQTFFSWHKKKLKNLKKKFNFSDYGLLWVTFGKGLIIGILIYHFIIK